MQGLERKKTEDILMEAGLLSSEKLKQVKEVGEKTGEKLEKILLSEDVINYKEILTMRAGKMGVDFVDLENVSVDKNAISVIKPQIAIKYSVFPFDIKNNLLHLAMQDPDDIFLIDEIKVFAQMEIKPFLADSRLLGKAIKYFYNDGSIKPNDASDMKVSTGESRKKEKDLSDVEELSKDSLQVCVFNADELIGNIILNAMRQGASDIHIDSIANKPRIRYRVDGTLIEESIRHNVGFEEIVNKAKVFAGLNTYDRTTPQKGTIKFDLSDNEKVNLEVLTLPVSGGEKLIMKLKNNKFNSTIEEIGLSEKEQKQVVEMLEKQSGMIIITGLAGSGKTTTGYALAKRLISKQLNMITLERKLAGRLEGVCQVTLESNMYSNISEYISCLVEHDPDVIFADIDINCTTDGAQEAFRKLMDISLSGKLVIVTMNFQSAYEAISGLLSTGFEKYMVASAVSGIVAQHLVRKKCSCHDSNSNKDKEICKLCSNIGYKGKMGIFEVFTMNKECKNLIVNDRNLETLENRIKNEYSSFKNNCIRLINDNLTTLDELVRIGIEKDMFNY